MADTKPISALDDETLARRYTNARKLAEQGDAQADQAARAMAQEINRRRGGAPSGASQPTRFGAGDGDAGVTGQFISGINEGLVTNTVGGILDLPNMAINLGIKGVNRISGTDIEELPYASDTLQSALEYDIPDIPLPFTDNTIAMGPMVARPPGTKGERFARRAGEFTGTSVGATIPMMGAARSGLSFGKYVDDVASAADAAVTSAPGKALLSEILAGGTAVAAGSGGGAVGERVGSALGFPETGRAVGQTAGEIIGGVAGATVPYTFGEAGRRVLADPKSPERYAAAQRLGVEPSTGLIGGQTAAYIENTAGLNPLAGRRIQETQSRQVGQTAAARDVLTERLREPSGAKLATNPYDAGTQIREVGQSALADLRAELGRLTDREMAALGGREQAIRIDRIKRSIETLLPSQTREGAELLRDKLASLEAIRTTPINKQLDAQLRKKLKSQQDEQAKRVDRLAELEAKKRDGTASSKELREARNLRSRMSGYRANIDRTMVQIDRNLGVRNDQLNNWRRELGQEIPNKGTVGSEEQRSVYGGVRDAQRDEAIDRGASAEFREVTDEKRRIAGSETLEDGGDVGFFQRMLKADARQPAEPQEVYNFLTQKNAAGRIKRYKENASPEDFQATMGNMIQIMGTPTSQTSATARGATEGFSPTQFLTNWRNLPPDVQSMIFDKTDIEQRTRDLVTLSEALSARGSASNPSGTVGTAIIAKTFSEGFYNPALTVVTLWGSAGLARAFMSEPVARAIANANPGLWAELKPVLAQRAAAAVQTESSE